ncbi:mitochondrial potassium channel-like [Cloeon dipterum]|uniref:mitochondrial potassium channel-like n=1 Tax=Cloeon dipterum TaxID=197152 RepID=UPI00321FCDED
MMRIDAQMARAILSRLKSVLKDKSTIITSNLRNRVQQQTTSNGAVVNAKIESAREWYEEFTGIDEVRKAQDKVVLSESKFIAAQEERRKANKRLSDVDTKLREIYGELERTRRGEDRYIFLVTQEGALMKERDTLSAEFQRYEQEERENFSFLSSAVKESHEKERLQAERTKYWSIICSILGTVLGCGLSALNNHYRLKEFRNILNQAMANKENVELLVTETLSDSISRELAKHNNLNLAKTTAVATASTEDYSKYLVTKDEIQKLCDALLVNVEQEKIAQGNSNNVFQTAVTGTALLCVSYALLKIFG